MRLVSLQLKTKKDFNKNLSNLIKQIKKTKKGSFILAPELVLTGYSYDKMDKAVQLTNKAIKHLKKLSTNKTIALTMITKKSNNYFNTLFVFHQNKIIHTQSKVQLFVLNDEKKYFTSGDVDDIRIFQVGDLKVASLICFELRFIDLWKKIDTADLILIPAMWGKPRKENFQILTRALAVMNQCFVLASNSANSDMAKSSSIITPFGKYFEDDTKKLIQQKVDLREIKKMRRYMRVKY